MKPLEKPTRITYPMYLTIKKFGKDVGGLILSFLWQCDHCYGLECGTVYSCQLCMPGKNLCQFCFDITTYSHSDNWCRKCSVCNGTHCRFHTSFNWYPGNYPFIAFH